jgi:hypothetical protein
MLAPTHGHVPVAPWAVINTHPHREEMALENLMRQGFIAYCPMLRRRRSHGRRITPVLRPLFPSYLFVSTGAPVRCSPFCPPTGSQLPVAARTSLPSITLIAQLRARSTVLLFVPEPYQVARASLSPMALRWPCCDHHPHGREDGSSFSRPHEPQYSVYLGAIRLRPPDGEISAGRWACRAGSRIRKPSHSEEQDG